jgi:hypothetical protein
MRTKELFAWIKERHSIATKKQQGKPKPWTQDTILQQYRFCNVYRELDTVTQWIGKNWRFPHRNDPHLWFAMVVARLFNWPPTLLHMGFPTPFNGEVMRGSLLTRRDLGEKLFSSAYIVSTNGKAMDKVDYLMKYVLQPLWDDRMNIYKLVWSKNTSLAEVHACLMQYDGLGSFMAAQVVADLKYVKPLNSAVDWEWFAASGPGSRRGLNRVMGNPLDKPWNEAQWHRVLCELKKEIDGLVRRAKLPTIHAQDLQNCLCEFDKYERTRLGEGKPRNTYPGGVS